MTLTQVASLMFNWDKTLGYAQPGIWKQKIHVAITVSTAEHIYIYTHHIRTNIGKELNLANWRIVTQSPSLNLANIFFCSISIVTLVVFEWFRQINTSPNPLFQQITKYYIHQYSFLYSIYIYIYIYIYI